MILKEYSPIGAVGAVGAETIQTLLAAIPNRPDYDTWLRIASAVWAVLPMEDGARLLHHWSPEERDGEYAGKHKARLQQVGVGTLFHLAADAGFDVRSHLATLAAERNGEKVPKKENIVRLVQTKGARIHFARTTEAPPPPPPARPRQAVEILSPPAEDCPTPALSEYARAMGHAWTAQARRLHASWQAAGIETFDLTNQSDVEDFEALYRRKLKA